VADKATIRSKDVNIKAEMGNSLWDKLLTSPIAAVIVILLGFSTIGFVTFRGFSEQKSLQDYKSRTAQLLNDWEQLKIAANMILISDDLNGALEKYSNKLNVFSDEFETFLNEERLKELANDNEEFNRKLEETKVFWQMLKSRLRDVEKEVQEHEEKTDVLSIVGKRSLVMQLGFKFGEAALLEDFQPLQKLIRNIESSMSTFSDYFVNSLSAVVQDISSWSDRKSQQSIILTFALIAVITIITLGFIITNQQELKKYRLHLEDLVYAKTKEITDIMNFIDQGIFTINPDMTINQEHSHHAEVIFGHEDFSNITLEEIFNTTEDRIKKFKLWYQMISHPNKIVRWEKYSYLCPFKEITRSKDDTQTIIQFAYQPIINEKNKMEKIMVLARDITRQREAERAIEKERERQQNQMERVTSLTSLDQDTVSDFIGDVSELLDTFQDVKTNADILRDAKVLYRNMHTIKGNAGSFGFSELSRRASDAEKTLQQALEHKSEDFDYVYYWERQVLGVRSEFDEIQKLRHKLFSGNKDSMQIDRKAFDTLLHEVISGRVSKTEEIYQKINLLDSHPFGNYCKKYARIVKMYREKNGKDIKDLRVLKADHVIHRKIMNAFDVALVHITRNCVDHGIETDDEREKLGKGQGQIVVDLEYGSDDICVKVSDDGRGISSQKLVEKAIRKGNISQEEADKMSEREKLDLIFMPGLSTKQNVTETSGRGIGMDAARDSVEKFGGRLTYETEEGKGTTFYMYLPLKMIKAPDTNNG